MSDSQSQPLAESNTHVLGSLLMITGMLMIPAMDAIAKWLANMEGMSPGQVTFYRFLFQLLCLIPFVIASGGFASLRPKHLWTNLLRGVLLAIASLMFFTAVAYMPIADAIAIFFVEPFILTAASAVFLGEKVGWRRWLAIAVGFAGALLIIQPSFEVFGAVALLPLGTATVFAAYLILNKVASHDDSPLVMQYVAGIGGALFLGLVLVGGNLFAIDNFEPSVPKSFNVWFLVALLGTIAAFGHLLVIRAFRMAPASLLAPFQYFEIISATLLGYIFFGDFPNLSKWVGILIIVLSGLFIVWREHRVRQPASKNPVR